MRRQSAHFDEYQSALATLDALRLTFPAFESRADLARMVGDRDVRERWPRDPDGVPVYPGAARQMREEDRQARIAAGDPYAVRLDMAKAMEWTGPLRWTETGAGPCGETGEIRADPAAWGDVIVGRKETPTSYHLSVVLDDAIQGVTHVVRGQDLFRSTSVHRMLQALLDLPAPVYHHHRLVLDAEGRKLSKSTQATGLRELAGGRCDSCGYPPDGRPCRIAQSAVACDVGPPGGRGAHGEDQAQERLRTGSLRNGGESRRAAAAPRPTSRSPRWRMKSARR